MAFPHPVTLLPSLLIVGAPRCSQMLVMGGAGGVATLLRACIDVVKAQAECNATPAVSLMRL